MPAKGFHQPIPQRTHHISTSFLAERVRALDMEGKQLRCDAPRWIATHRLHSARSQVSPTRSCPKLRCGWLFTSTKPAS
ncbi:hypothetical protein ACVJGD_007510 [Bradyrhizobium sp. USDA 10063]